jgi:dephospho-CoA kinase
MITLGLTGSIGMGKSATAAMFAAEGCPVYDADAEVHRIYAAGGPAVEPVEAAFPGVVRDGAIDRARLSERVLNDAEAFQRLNGIVWPLLGAARREFFRQAEADQVPIVVLDIPLLFETGGDRRVDAVAVVSAPADLQRARAFERPGMTEEKFRALIAKQMPDEEKRRRADFVVDSSQGPDYARAQVHAILRQAGTLPIRRS